MHISRTGVEVDNTILKTFYVVTGKTQSSEWSVMAKTLDIANKIAAYWSLKYKASCSISEKDPDFLYYIYEGFLYKIALKRQVSRILVGASCATHLGDDHIDAECECLQ